MSDQPFDAQAEECTTVLSAVCTSAPACPRMIACRTFLGSCDAGTFPARLENAGAA